MWLIFPSGDLVAYTMDPADTAPATVSVAENSEKDILGRARDHRRKEAEGGLGFTISGVFSFNVGPVVF